MKNFILAMALVLWASGALADHTYSEGDPGRLFHYKIVLDSTTNATRGLISSPACSVKVNKVGAGDINLYECPTAGTAIGSCTLEKTFSASTDAAYNFEPGQSYLKVAAATASTASEVEIFCPTTASRSGGTPTVEYAALSSVNPTSTPFVKVTDCDSLTCAAPGTGSTHVPFYYNGTVWGPFPGATAGIASVQADASPTLGADLDADGNAIDGATAYNQVLFPSIATLQTAIDSCQNGSNDTVNFACKIVLPPGRWPLTSTIRLGGATLATMQNGFGIEGRGAGVLNSLGNTLAGTTLYWAGADGGTMMEVSGFGHTIEGIHLDGHSCVDLHDTGGPPQTTGSPDGFCDSDGSTAQVQAAYGIIQSGDNSASAPTGKNVYRNIAVNNITDTSVTDGGYGFSFGISNLGQNDHTIIENMRFYNVRHCLQQRDQQAVANEVRDMECAGFTESPGIRIDYGGIKFSQGFVGTSLASATYFQIDYCATEVTIDGLNTEHGGGDSKLVAKSNLYGGACGYGSNYQHRMINNRVQFQATGSAPHYIMDWDGQGSWLLAGNTWMSNNSDANRKGVFNFPAPGTRDRFITMLGNKTAWDNGTDTSDPAMTITAAGGAVNKVLRGDRGRWEILDKDGSFAIAKDATSPFVDLDNDGTFNGSDSRLLALGDINTVGDCTTGACFEGAGSESTIKAIGNVLIDLDDDNNTANSHFYVRTGANAAVLDVDELGNALALTSFYSPSIQGATEVLVGEDTSTTGTLKFYHSDGGVQTIAPPAGSGSIAYTLPSNDGAAGEQLTSDGSGGLSWASPAGVASGDAANFFGNDITNTAGFVFDAGTGLSGSYSANASPTPSDVLLSFDFSLAYANLTAGAEYCYFTASGTGAGGFACEGQTNNGFEYYFTFPTQAESGADAEKFIVLADATQTLTNKTLDAEGTGNVLTTVERIWFPAAGCNNATPTPFFDLPTSNAAEAGCVTGTNTQKGVLDFDQTVAESAQVTHLLPSDWTATGGVDVKLKWLTTATSSSVAWNVASICVADAETDDPAFNTASVVVDATKGTTNQTNDASITGLTVTGCAAGELLHLKVSRDPTNVSDATLADARLIGFELTYRRAI